MAILTVGSGQQYATIGDAVRASHDGDVVKVQAGTYVNDFATVNTKITIEGVGGMAHLLATVPPPDGKAILSTNTSVTLDHLEFSGAAVGDGNGAGIRYQGGDMMVTNCYFHDNQDGILGGAVPGGTITIRNSEFAAQRHRRRADAQPLYRRHRQPGGGQQLLPRRGGRARDQEPGREHDDHQQPHPGRPGRHWPATASTCRTPAPC